MDKWTILNNIQAYAEKRPSALPFLEQLKNDIEQWSKESITWSVDDFHGRAVEMEHDADPNFEYEGDDSVFRIYDPEKFQEALERMISGHDATIGITWDNIDALLDEYCKK